MQKIVSKLYLIDDVHFRDMVYGIRDGVIYLLARVDSNPIIRYNLVQIHDGNLWSSRIEGESKNEVITKAWEDDFEFYRLENKDELIKLLKGELV